MTSPAYFSDFEDFLQDAYYSVVRFSPDSARGEQVNIAVILESPEAGFVDVKIRKGMKRLLKALAPHIDERLILDFVTGLANDVSARPSKFKGDALFPRPDRPIHIDSLYSDLENASHKFWTVSEPQHLVVSKDAKWQDEINHLYATYLANYAESPVEVWDKQKVQGYSYTHLRQRDITLDLHPEPIRGEVFDNEFDAQFDLNDMHGHFQFFSYDTVDPDLNQMIRFLGSVEDARDSGFREDNGHYFIPIIKRPQSRSGQIKYQKATNYCAKKKVRVMTPDDSDYERIAQAFKRGEGQLLTRI